MTASIAARVYHDKGCAFFVPFNHWRPPIRQRWLPLGKTAGKARCFRYFTADTLPNPKLATARMGGLDSIGEWSL